MFEKITLHCQAYTFDELLKGVQVESVTRGRTCGNLVLYKEGYVSLVRTTTSYELPNQQFQPVHEEIIGHIRSEHGIELNNAMLEVYDNTYRTMKFHSDQSLDLSEDSCICIYTCYKDPTEKHLRKLCTKNKQTGEVLDIMLEHNSIVVFDMQTNRSYLHKIMLDGSMGSEWLGITFRKAKTFICFVDEQAYFKSGRLITLANEEQKREFLICRGQENKNIYYTYPEMDYTLSMGDLKPPCLIIGFM